MDICYKMGDVGFNVRVAAFITYQDKILISKRKDKDYYSLPGGKIALEETSKEALQRELQEELGINISLEEMSLVRIVENFYSFEGRKVHEYLFIYKIELDDNDYAEKLINFENQDMKMKWVLEEEFVLLNIMPGIIKGITDNTFRHLIIKK